jgi:hypothetical protein
MTHELTPNDLKTRLVPLVWLVQFLFGCLVGFDFAQQLTFFFSNCRMLNQITIDQDFVYSVPQRLVLCSVDKDTLKNGVFTWDSDGIKAVYPRFPMAGSGDALKTKTVLCGNQECMGKDAAVAFTLDQLDEDNKEDFDVYCSEQCAQTVTVQSKDGYTVCCLPGHSDALIQEAIAAYKASLQPLPREDSRPLVVVDDIVRPSRVTLKQWEKQEHAKGRIVQEVNNAPSNDVYQMYMPQEFVPDDLIWSMPLVGRKHKRAVSYPVPSVSESIDAVVFSRAFLLRASECLITLAPGSRLHPLGIDLCNNKVYPFAANFALACTVDQAFVQNKEAMLDWVDRSKDSELDPVLDAVYRALSNFTLDGLRRQEQQHVQVCEQTIAKIQRAGSAVGARIAQVIQPNANPDQIEEFEVDLLNVSQEVVQELAVVADACFQEQAEEVCSQVEVPLRELCALDKDNSCAVQAKAFLKKAVTDKHTHTLAQLQEHARTYRTNIENALKDLRSGIGNLSGKVVQTESRGTLATSFGDLSIYARVQRNEPLETHQKQRWDSIQKQWQDELDPESESLESESESSSISVSLSEESGEFVGQKRTLEADFDCPYCQDGSRACLVYSLDLHRFYCTQKVEHVQVLTAWLNENTDELPSELVSLLCRTALETEQQQVGLVQWHTLDDVYVRNGMRLYRYYQCYKQDMNPEEKYQVFEHGRATEQSYRTWLSEYHSGVYTRVIGRFYQQKAHSVGNKRRKTN